MHSFRDLEVNKEKKGEKLPENENPFDVIDESFLEEEIGIN
eukprot:CAMPEP_0170565606 /NCGR_PEP_ID=MMETSP0211-20121228/79297_1 /TAXON_ID=311385 /ORGANISM="Pseudokeronopsis sp., Strain OXSARD2" /LENGTH=40 /DNA_ID= /DNA_START= /DNA_END= /DNA_ORIENTATION=